MDRVTKLAEEAERHLSAEEIEDMRDSRLVTRRMLSREARILGFPENEITAAINTALGGR